MNNEMIQAKVIDQNDQEYFLQAEGIIYALDRQEMDLNLGQLVDGFAYQDKDQKPRMTTKLPRVNFKDFDWGEVVESRRDLGVFVDIGLKNKDIVVSLDDLPDDYKDWPQKGDHLYLKLKKDNKERLWGHLGLEEDLQRIGLKAQQHMMNHNVEAYIYRLLTVGAQVYTTQNMLGFIHESEMIEPLRLGQKIKGRIIDVHLDGKVNISTRPRAYQAIDEDAMMLLTLLKKHPDHFLPLHDKTDPQVIHDYLGISKGQFKRALGALLKAGKVNQVKGEGIYLNNQRGEHNG